MIYNKLGVSIFALAIILNANAEDKSQNFSELEVKYSALEQKVNLLEENVKELQAQLRIRAESVKSNADDIAGGPGNMAALVSSDKKEEINNVKHEEAVCPVIPESLVSYNNLILKKKYNEAIIALQKFITKSRSDNDRGVAYYLMAESYYLQGNKKQAAEDYLRSYKNYPRNVMAADSLLKLAIYLSEKQNKESACNLLSRLEIEYPNRSISNQEISNTLSKKLNCDL